MDEGSKHINKEVISWKRGGDLCENLFLEGGRERERERAIEKTCKGQVGMMGHGKARKEKFRAWAWRVTPNLVLTRLTSIAEPKERL